MTYRDARLPTEDRVSDLLSQMTLEEKLAQMTQLPAWTAYLKTPEGTLITDVFQSVTRPMRELKGFERIDLMPGKSETVGFELGFAELSIWDAGLRRVVEPGTFTVMVGGSQHTTLEVTLNVVET